MSSPIPTNHRPEYCIERNCSHETVRAYGLVWVLYWRNCMLDWRYHTSSYHKSENLQTQLLHAALSAVTPKPEFFIVCVIPTPFMMCWATVYFVQHSGFKHHYSCCKSPKFNNFSFREGRENKPSFINVGCIKPTTLFTVPTAKFSISLFRFDIWYFCPRKCFLNSIQEIFALYYF